MVKAFVLIHAEAGKENTIDEELKKLKMVEEIIFVLGDYDIIVRVEAEDKNTLTEIVTRKIRKIDGVISTATLDVRES